MKLALVTIAKGGVRWADLATAHWLGRVAPQLPVEEIRLRPADYKGDVARAQAAEGERVLALLRGGDRLVAVDERGEHPGSEAFADWITRAANAGTRRLVFALGGPYGHGDAVRAQAWRTLALSGLVLNHEVARVVLAEQIYRASTILWGGGYHHG